jgi:NADP-dependent 3-hydroxy acid dehydrogenase YdfG
MLVVLMAGTLDGTVALITGASSGIGRATAIALAAEGAAVAAVARRKDRLDELVGELGAKAVAIEGDVAAQGAGAEIVERAVAELGRLDILINNAGLMLLGPIEDAPLEEWRRMLAVNVAGLLEMTHAAIPHLLRAVPTSPRKVADIVNVSSVAGRIAREGSGVYNLTKWGVGAFSESLRQELTTRYVRVSLVEPGVTQTELTSHMRADIREQSQARFAGVKQLAAQDIAEAISFIVTRDRDVAINELMVRPTLAV